LSDELDETIKVYQEEVEKVKNFVFLGSSVPTTTLDVKRVALAATVFEKLKKIHS